MRLRVLLEEKHRQQMGLDRGTQIEWRGVGRGALIYGFIAKTQARLAKSYGSAVGDEKLAAAEAAREERVPFELIDMDSQTVFRNWMRKMSRRERAKIFLSGVGGLFKSKRRVEKGLSEYYAHADA